MWIRARSRCLQIRATLSHACRGSCTTAKTLVRRRSFVLECTNVFRIGHGGSFVSTLIGGFYECSLRLNVAGSIRPFSRTIAKNQWVGMKVKVQLPEETAPGLLDLGRHSSSPFVKYKSRSRENWTGGIQQATLCNKLKSGPVLQYGIQKKS